MQDTHVMSSTHNPPPSSYGSIFFLGCVTAILIVSIAAGLQWLAMTAPTRAAQPLVIAPMIGGLDPCLIQAGDPHPSTLPPECSGAQGHAGTFIESTLTPLGTPARKDWVVGYTLKAGLFDFLQPDPHQTGQWVVNHAAMQRVVNTIAHVKRPVVLYLFSTHFSSQAPIEKELLKDPQNLAHTLEGPLAVESYLNAPLLPWSVAHTDNSLTGYRIQVAQALAQSLCQQPDTVRDRIMGITLLGEVHQLFPGFETGMGFQARSAGTDYSAYSQQEFRRFLQQRFGSIQHLNKQLGSNFTDWEQVQAPSRDIRSQPLDRFEQHIDAYAHGRVPISGWVAPPASGDARKLGHVSITLNGILLARTPVGLNRQEVLEALPELRSAETGWRYDLNFAQLPPGIHRLEMYLERPDEPMVYLGSRRISVMDKQQSTPHPISTFLPIRALKRLSNVLGYSATPSAPTSLRFSIDSPVDQFSYFYNPLVPLWHAWRNLQVQHYLQNFQKAMTTTCLGTHPLHTHQLFPHANPSWDANKFALDHTLEALPGLHLGVSLYGEAATGVPTYSSFATWWHQRKQRAPQGSFADYGITEFHPLRALSSQQLGSVLTQHQRQGARFISMSLEARDQQGRRLSPNPQASAWVEKTAPYPFSFEPEGTQHNAAELYHALQGSLQNPHASDASTLLWPHTHRARASHGMKSQTIASH